MITVSRSRHQDVEQGATFLHLHRIDPQSSMDYHFVMPTIFIHDCVPLDKRIAPYYPFTANLLLLVLDCLFASSIPSSPSHFLPTYPVCSLIQPTPVQEHFHIQPCLAEYHIHRWKTSFPLLSSAAQCSITNITQILWH